jgi:hypothetical protein
MAGITEGGFFLRKKPLRIPVSVESRIETAVIVTQMDVGRNWEVALKNPEREIPRNLR